MTAWVAQALGELGVGDPAEPRRTRAVVEGLGLAVLLGRMSPTDAVAALEHHVHMLVRASGSPG